MSEEDYRSEIVRDYGQIDRHLQTLDARDVACHESPHVVARRLAIVASLHPFLQALEVRTVLDVGAAGITRTWWLEHGYEWHAAGFPRDVDKLRSQGIYACLGDLASLPFEDGSFDLLYASHVAEHSPMPLVALLEARRVARALALIVPAWPRLVDEPYHYSVAPREMWQQWLTVAGWWIAADLSGSRDFVWLALPVDDAAARERIAPAVQTHREQSAERRLKAEQERAARAKARRTGKKVVKR